MATGIRTVTVVLAILAAGILAVAYVAGMAYVTGGGDRTAIVPPAYRGNRSMFR